MTLEEMRDQMMAMKSAQDLDPAGRPQSMDAGPGALTEESAGELEALRTKMLTMKAGQGPEKPEHGTIANFSRGMNYKTAQAISLPAEVVNELGELVGVEIGKPGAARDKIREWMAKYAGMPSDVDNNLSGNMGANTAEGLYTLGGLTPFLGKLAASGTGKVAQIAGNIYKSIVNRPVAAVTSEVGSQIGSTLGGDLTEGSTGGTMAGAIVGGSIGTTMANRVRGAVDAVGTNIVRPLMGKMGVVQPGPNDVANGPIEQAKMIFRKGVGGRPKETDPIRNPDEDPRRAQVFAQEQVEGAMMRLDQTVERAVQAVPTSGTPAQIQSKVNELLDRSEEIGNRIVSDFWKRTPMKERIPMSKIAADVRAIQPEWKQTPSAFGINGNGDPITNGPADFMTRLVELSTPIRGPNGRMQASLPTVQRLRDFRGEVRRARLGEEGKGKQGLPVNDAMVRNFNRIESVIDDGIQHALPNDVTIQQARAMSIKYNDLFSRGAIRDIMARKSTGEAMVNPGQTVEHLMGRFEGLNDLAEVNRKLNTQRAPGGKGFAVTAPERAEIQSMVAETENAIRSMFREEAASQGPEAAAKWVRKHEESIKPLARVSVELDRTASQVEQAMIEKKTIERSALARFAKSDSVGAIQRVWSSADPKADARQLMVSFRGDKAAQEALQSGVVDELMLRARSGTEGVDPSKLKGLLQSTKYGDMLNSVLRPDQMKRLNEVADLGMSLNTDGKTWREKFLPGGQIMGRVLGAMFGRKMGEMTGSSTIQVPAAFARVGQQSIEKMLRSTPPNELVKLAIVDQKWERLLHSRVPVNTKELRATQKQLGRLLGSITGTLNSAQGYMGDGFLADE